MHLPNFFLSHALAIFLASVGPVTLVRAQEGGEERKKKSSVQVRLLCSRPVENSTALSLLQGESVLHEVDLIPLLVSDPLGVARGDMILARRAAAGAKPEPLLRVPMPAEGTRFILALFPAADEEGNSVYRHVLIRTDNLRFGKSDLYLMNLTRLSIAGTLGTKKFSLASGKSDVVTPVPSDGDRMYQARFYHDQDGQPQLFSDTRWPLAVTARDYLFFLPDPESQTITYLSFREYEPFP